MAAHKIQRLRFFGPELVLDEVSGGEIKKIGEIMLEQFDAGAEEEGAGVSAVEWWGRPTSFSTLSMP